MSSFATPVLGVKPPATVPQDLVRRPDNTPSMSNQALLRRLSATSPRLQPKLEIGAADDPLEREADAVAAQVMGMADPSVRMTAPLQVSRQCASCEEEDKTLRAKPAAAAPLAGVAPAQVHAVLGQSGRPLDAGTRAFFEPRLGVDLSGVRVHTEAQAGTAAHAVGARAFTVGENIVFAPGQFAPSSSAGRHLLAHELAHVVQQRGGAGARRVQRAPPLLKQLTVNVPGPVKAEATTAITPHMHLGVKFTGPSGVGFKGEVIGGANADGEIFFSQVVRNSERRFRMAKDGETQTVKDELDGGTMYKSTAQPVAPGTTIVTDTDTPGQSDQRLANPNNPGRATIRINDQFELFLMWRPNSSSPVSDWLTYGSVNWSWDAAATGLTAQPPTKLPWLAPREPFNPCKSIFGGGSLSIVNRKASPASHLGLTVHQSGRVPVSPLPTNVFADTDATDPVMEKGCP